MEAKPAKACCTYMAEVMMPDDANPMGNVHGGAIMSRLDNAAGVTAIRHARKNVVTASVDRLDFHNPCYVGDLLILRSSVNHAGRTSMEIGVRVEAENLVTGEGRHIASSYSTFVALDEDGKPTEVPPVKPETDEEKRRFAEAKRRREQRIKNRSDK